MSRRTKSLTKRQPPPVRRRLERAHQASWILGRPQVDVALPVANQFPRGAAETHGALRAGDLVDLLRACLVLLRVPEAQVAAYRPRPPPFWRAADALARIEELLGTRQKGRVLTAFLPAIAKDAPDRPIRCRAAVASTLIAGLELSRAGVTTMEQDVAWSTIWIESRQRKPTLGEEMKQAG